MRSFTRLSQFLTLLLSAIHFPAQAAWELNMPRGVTPLSHAMFDLHMAMLWVCVAIGVAVFGVMLYAIIYHRKALGHQAANFHESVKVEIAWTVLPFIILTVMAIPATKTLIEMHDTAKSDITIAVTGYRWYWHYEYLNEGINFYSYSSTTQEQINNLIPKGPHYLLEVDRPLVVPINKKIRFAFSAKDVIHAWWIPELGIKKDALPGFINESWTIITKPGTYRGQCAELCGAGHAYMPIVVEAKTQEDYAAWLQAQQTPAPAPAAEPVTEPAPVTEPVAPTTAQIS